MLKLTIAKTAVNLRDRIIHFYWFAIMNLSENLFLFMTDMFAGKEKELIQRKKVTSFPLSNNYPNKNIHGRQKTMDTISMLDFGTCSFI
ncbi:hypothetical protein [Desulfotignum phosphitoxidans]|uniref:Uncharacterized protein n=1 Tax=Desulfotignum phosphitoxidans DSM 13687 TaxID=1286635 RepID=S0G3M1_9BACT|nr:hypothetical protein [Desulfotignum phosphitoxidans]EMS78411.1 hypothetical protein DUF1566 [Desulfotignum phosphitoxidans DSM 13687]